MVCTVQVRGSECGELWGPGPGGPATPRPTSQQLRCPARQPALLLPAPQAPEPGAGRRAGQETVRRAGGGAGDREEGGFSSSQQSSPVFLVEYLLFIPNQPNQSLKLTHCTNLPTLLYNK